MTSKKKWVTFDISPELREIIDKSKLTKNEPDHITIKRMEEEYHYTQELRAQERDLVYELENLKDTVKFNRYGNMYKRK